MDAHDRYVETIARNLHTITHLKDALAQAEASTHDLLIANHRLTSEVEQLKRKVRALEWALQQEGTGTG